MVLITAPKTSQAARANCELMLESGRCIHYVAPPHINPSKDAYSEGESISSETVAARRKSSYGANDTIDDWEGVYALCHVLDNMIRYESEEFMDGKDILEIGFSTGLPSMLALENGAAHVTLHSMDKDSLYCYIKATFKRNKVKETKRKFVTGDLENLKKSTKPKQFDVILAPEYINANLTEFEALHDFLDYALTPDGVCLMTARSFYYNCDGNLPEFLALVKSKGKFDAYVRWSSSKLDVVQRKVVQLTRLIR